MSTTWTDSNGQPVIPVEELLPGYTRSEIEINAAAPSVQSYNSVTYFTTPPGLPTSATNAPAYVYNWTSEEITVQCK